ncbi:MAG: hypothetical protein GY856_17110 [bacterium]|nr:hypothetical protein [bacterium]
MPVKIQNLTNRAVLLRFSSGRTLHLAPQGTSPEVMATDLSSRIRKLEARHLIRIEDVAPAAKLKKKEPARAAPRKKERAS